MGDLVDEKGERQNAKEREQVDSSQGEADVEIVQQIVIGHIKTMLLSNRMTNDDALHVNGHGLSQPVLVQVVRLSSQKQIGLVGLKP